jgi:galactokinase
VDSGVRHSVSAADYGSVRVGAFMGYRIIADLAGLRVATNPVSVSDSKWHGYIANVTPAEFESVYRDKLPERIGGAEFLKRYTNTTDTVTRVDPERDYAVRIPAAHPIYEHDRVQRFRALLQDGAEPLEQRLQQLGELMYGSHASYSACGLGSDGTDRLVQLVRAAGPSKGLFGAKITGGGSGGTVAVIGRRGADAAIAEICQQYQKTTGHQPYVFRGSSPGAAAFGVVRLNWH